MQDRLKRLPKVQTLLETELASQLIQTYGHEDVANAIRVRLQDARETIIANDHEPDLEAFNQSLFDDISQSLDIARASSLRRAINATGIIIHTNLGRARLAPKAIEAMTAVAADYSTLEMDVETGKRGSRHDHVEALICQLTGAEAALVVNNCAAAILTCLTALGAGKPVVASRGEMVEIGGSFRMPDVIAQSGAHLREVGTTNKTHLRDYADAIDNDTALLLKSHTSNYQVIGFTSVPSRQELAALAQQTGTHLIEDLGSGVLVDLALYGLPNEPVVRDVLAAGVDVVTFSGDKLLGGPQAGIIAGRRALIDQIKTHPIARAVRIDKLSLAALRATLDLYRAPNNPVEQIPVLQTLATSLETLRARARKLTDLIGAKQGLSLEIVATVARAGAGSLPQQDLPSLAVSVSSTSHSPDRLAKMLRQADTPVFGRISKDQLLLDMRAVVDSDITEIANAVSAISIK